jgi:hypothetical protein
METGEAAGAVETVMERDLVAEAAVVAESVTFTVNVEVPDADGVPEMTPDELSVSPEGRVPDERDQV